MKRLHVNLIVCFISDPSTCTYDVTRRHFRVNLKDVA